MEAAATPRIAEKQDYCTIFRESKRISGGRPFSSIDAIITDIWGGQNHPN